MVVPPPQWSSTTGGDPSFFEQGVFNPEGVYGEGRAKMVGFSPFGFDGYDPGDPTQYGLQMSLGGSPLFEGKKGLMQCGINPATGEYMKDAEGKARCWYVPVSAASGFTRGGGGAWVNTDRDIIRYSSKGGKKMYGYKAPLGMPINIPTPYVASAVYTPGSYSPMLKGPSPVPQHYNSGRFSIAVSIPLLIGIGFFIWRIMLNKKLLKKEKPSLLAYIFHWDLWPLWGLKYKT